MPGLAVFLKKLNVFLRLWLRAAFAEKYKVFITLCTNFFKNTMFSLCFSVARLKLVEQILHLLSKTSYYDPKYSYYKGHPRIYANRLACWLAGWLACWLSAAGSGSGRLGPAPAPAGSGSGRLGPAPAPVGSGSGRPGPAPAGSGSGRLRLRPARLRLRPAPATAGSVRLRLRLRSDGTRRVRF